MSGCFLKSMKMTVIWLVLFCGLFCPSYCADTNDDLRLIVYSAPNETEGYEPVPPDVPLPANVSFSLRSPVLGFITVDTDPNETVYIRNELLNLPWVHEIETDLKRTTGTVVKDEMVLNSSPDQWAIERIGVNSARPFGQDSSICKVAVISTGADGTHPDTGILDLGYDWATQDSRPVDEDGYGTALCGVVSLVAGNISQKTTNSSLIIIPERIGVTNENFSASLSAFAIAHATDAGADIILMGYGGSEPSRAEERAIAYAKKHGVLLIAPSGDEDSNNMHYPSDHFDVISVGSVAKTDGLSYFSNYGIYTELVAPGEDLITPCQNMSYCRGTGTGFAAAEVAGVAALVKSHYPGLNSEEIRSILQSSATDLGRTGRDIYYGYGLLNAPAAMKAAEDLTLQKTLMAFNSGNNSHEMKRAHNSGNSVLHEMRLVPGWNFISIPGPLRSKKTAHDLFSNVNTDGHTIWTYKKTGEWIPLKPDSSPAPMEGMLVYSETQAFVPLVLNINTNSTLAMEKGWNLAGSPYLGDVPAHSLSSSSNLSWVSILTFNSTMQQYNPAIISGAEGTFSDNRNISPFTSFWIFMDTTGTFIRSSGI
ncbi:S8 family serine peptidase [Methanospirillum sp.]|uniref:S8 family serine peptidase n=1 Tax=Methanospirillum sp. TaxID=45200 RepID=UPI0035A05F2F